LRYQLLPIFRWAMFHWMSPKPTWAPRSFVLRKAGQLRPRGTGGLGVLWNIYEYYGVIKIYIYEYIMEYIYMNIMEYYWNILYNSELTLFFMGFTRQQTYLWWPTLSMCCHLGFKSMGGSERWLMLKSSQACIADWGTIPIFSNKNEGQQPRTSWFLGVPSLPRDSTLKMERASQKSRDHTWEN
jgi:hypothetical protein